MSEKIILNNENVEKEPEVHTKVILEVMRHGKREYHPDPVIDDSPGIKLTQEGRWQADERGKELEPQKDVSVGLGSPRIRSQETAYRVMLAEEELDSDTTIEEIEKRLDEEMKGVGKKMIVDPRLDFNSKGPIGADGKKAYREGRYMSWVINDSDGDAIEKHDTTSSTLTRMAGDVADLVKRYTKVGENFNKLASKTDKYKDYGNQLERYLGTHQGVAESFVASVLEKVKGEESKNEFVDSVDSGFVETEGVHIEIVNKGDQQHIDMEYTIKDPKNGDRVEKITFEKDVLEDILEDRTEFESKVLKE